jgi:hypothetical protein
MLSLPLSLPLGWRIGWCAKLIQIIGVSLVIASLLMFGLPYQALAQTNSTTVDTLSLTPTIENIGVISDFSGDDNGNNTTVLEYRGEISGVPSSSG